MKFNRWDVSMLHFLWNDIDYAILPWAGSLITSCFSCFMVNILKLFRVIAVATEKNRLVPLNAIPTGKPVENANAAIGTPSVITVDVLEL